MVCRQCGTENQRDAKFCGNCGSDLVGKTAHPRSSRQDNPGWFYRFCLAAVAVWTCFLLGSFLAIGRSMLSHGVTDPTVFGLGFGVGFVLFAGLWFVGTVVLLLLALATRPIPPVQWPRASKVATVSLAMLALILPLVKSTRPPLPSTPTSPPSPGGRVNPKDGLKYVWIPPGSFQMGCSPGDYECEDYEKPPHQVSITKGFWLGQTEVTVGAYKRFAGATGRQMPPAPVNVGRPLNPGWGDEDMPIVDVTWDEARAYCSWLGGWLPTEGEWEYAARAGSTADRYGDVDEIAWYADNSGRERLDSIRIFAEDPANYVKRLSKNGNNMHEVGQKRANGFGLYDMLGNVGEWVNDWYDQSYYQNSPSQDPTGPTSGTERVMRGGSWLVLPRFVRVSLRDSYNPRLRLHIGGFRCRGEVFPP
jgi:formylglycine-generating enzyme required for sulfatase activity